MTAITNNIGEEPFTVEQVQAVATSESQQQHQEGQFSSSTSSSTRSSSKKQQQAVLTTAQTTVRVVQRRQAESDGGDVTSSSISNDDDVSSSDFVIALDSAAAAAAASLEMEEEGEQQQQQQQLQQQQQEEIHQQEQRLVQQRQTSMSYFGYLYSNLKQRHAKSLSKSPTTPCLLRWLVPLLSLTTHVIFLYGQLAPMWRLHLSIHVDTWANATSYESRSVFSTIGIPITNHVYANQETDVKEFTFMFAISELWKAVGMPGKILPRLAAILLILFSGVWPHLKLLLLQCTWLMSNRPTRRTRVLHWLGTLGKWSLADVLAVCVMVGVLHLDWIVDPFAMKHGLISNFTLLLTVARAVYGNAQDICTAGLAPLDCHDEHNHHNGWDDWGKCKACITLVNSAMDHPDTAQRTFQSVLNGVDVSGDGLIYLRVQGMRGIYAFCLAVIMSILISLMVDILDVRSHHHNHNHRRLGDDDDETSDQGEEEEIIFQPNNNNNNINNTITAVTTSRQILDVNQTGEDNHNLGAPLLLSLPPPPRNNTDLAVTAAASRRYQNRPNGRRRRRLRLRAPPPVRANCCLQCLRYLSLLGSTGVTFGIVVAAIWYHTIARVVTGAIPQVLGKVLGVVWNRPYSLYSLVQTTGAAGGFDLLLMATFGLFVVAGPVIRALLCIVAALTNTTSATANSGNSPRRKLLLSSIEFIGAFCAWEVFAAAVFMVNLLMPAITSTIIMKPECAELDPESGSCLQVEFQLEDSFALLLLGGALLLFGARNLHHHHHHGQHTRSPSSESSSAAFEYSMVVQSEISAGMPENNDNDDDRNVAAPTTIDDSATLTSGIV